MKIGGHRQSLFRATAFEGSKLEDPLNPISPGGPYGPPNETFPDNSKLTRAEGPGFWDFKFNLVMHVS